MIEVVVASLIVALAAAAVFSGFSSVSNIVASQRHEGQANSLAEQDAQRLRALSVTELTSTEPSENSCPSLATGQTFGNACYTQTINGELYTITSTSKFVAASGGAASCTTSGLTAADYVETSSSVTWAHSSGRPPVVVHSVISPHPGGALVIQAQNPSNASLPGVTINVQGPSPSTSTQALTTDSSGCVVFGGLQGGNYTVSWPGYVNQGSVPSASIIVVDGLTQTDTYQLSQAGAIQAQFTTTYNGQTNASGTDDTFVASNSNLSSPLLEGTVNAFTSSPITTPSTVFPFSNSYSVYAGYCSGDAPPSPQTALVTPGATTTVTVPEPAMVVDVQNSGGEYNDVNPSANVGNGDTNTSDLSWNPNAKTAITYVGGWTHVVTGFGDYFNDETFASSTSAYVTVSFTGTSIEWLTSIYNNHGNATVTLYNGTGTGGTVAQAANTYSDYSSYTQAPVGLYNSGPLTYGTYTLKIAPTGGTPPPGSGGTNVSIDGFIVGTNATTAYNQSNGGTLNYTSGTTTVAYSGSWTYANNQGGGGVGGDGGSAGDSSQDEAYSNTTGNKVTVTFTGTSIAWISKLYSNHGNATIQLKNSGGTVIQSGTYSDYDADTEYQAAPYSSGPLAYGTYTLTITVAGTEPSGASGTYLTMDGFIIGTGAPSLTTISPHVVITDNNAGCSGQQTTPPAQVPTNANVGALVNPAEPYGNFTVCADDGSVANSATLANTNFTQGNVVNIDLTDGESGVTNGTCSSPAVTSPYSTYSSAAAYMSQSTNSFTIDAAGADVWWPFQNDDQYGAIYLPGGSVSSSTTTVEVNTQQNTNTWAKAGIMLRDSIAGSPTSQGYAVLVVTPGQGVSLEWDGSSAGVINQQGTTYNATAPIWLQLIRNGNSITGRYSTNDSTWTTVGTPTLTGATTTEDVGMFSVSHNPGVLGVATFSNFSNS